MLKRLVYFSSRMSCSHIFPGVHFSITLEVEQFKIPSLKIASNPYLCTWWPQAGYGLNRLLVLTKCTPSCSKVCCGELNWFWGQHRILPVYQVVHLQQRSQGFSLQKMPLHALAPAALPSFQPACLDHNYISHITSPNWCAVSKFTITNWAPKKQSIRPWGTS